jgi:hypothetical protein
MPYIKLDNDKGQIDFPVMVRLALSTQLSLPSIYIEVQFNIDFYLNLLEVTKSYHLHLTDSNISIWKAMNCL